MKDHEIAKTVNELRDIALQFHNTQQLRERIARVVVPLLHDAHPVDWKQHIKLQPVACADEPDAHHVIFKVGVQSFVIGNIAQESKEHADWFAAQFVKALENASTAPQPNVWRCFHCGEVFTDAEQAALHFGPTQFSKPACQFDVAALRETEALLRRYQEEDTDLHREIHGLHAQHNADLRREEEKGYARGLQDGNDIEVMLAALTNEQRLELFGKYCTACGSNDPNCCCMRDD